MSECFKSVLCKIIVHSLVDELKYSTYSIRATSFVRLAHIEFSVKICGDQGIQGIITFLIQFFPPSFYCDACSWMVQLVRTQDFSLEGWGGGTLGLTVIIVLFKEKVTKIISYV